MNRKMIAVMAVMMGISSAPSFACEGLSSLSQDSGSAQMPLYATHGIRWANRGPAPFSGDGSQGLVQSANSLPGGWTDTSSNAVTPQFGADMDKVAAMQSCTTLPTQHADAR